MTSTSESPVTVLSRALGQTAEVLAEVQEQHLSQPSPCTEWNVQHLIDHLVDSPRRFLEMMRGEDPDWSAEPPRVLAQWAGEFRKAADDLIAAWQQQEPAAVGGADWQTAEYAIHTWDVARAIGRSTDDLDPEVAERGLAFMRANLTDDNRAPAFNAAQAAAEGATPYDRLAAFAGRTP